MKKVLCVFFIAVLLLAGCSPAQSAAGSADLPESSLAESGRTAGLLDFLTPQELDALKLSLGEKYCPQTVPNSGSTYTYDCFTWKETIDDAARIGQLKKNRSYAYITLIEEIDGIVKYKNGWGEQFTYWLARVEKPVIGDLTAGQLIKVCTDGYIASDGHIVKPGKMRFPETDRKMFTQLVFGAAAAFNEDEEGCFLSYSYIPLYTEVIGEDEFIVMMGSCPDGCKKAGGIAEVLNAGEYAVLTVPSKQSESGYDELALVKPEALEKAYIEAFERARQEEAKS